MTSTATNIPYAMAGLVLLMCAAVHAFMGGPEINAPVQTSALDPVIRAVMAAVWHALTGLFLVQGLGMVWVAWRGGQALVLSVLAVALVFTGLFLGIGITSLGNVTDMPQWTLFATIAVLSIWGLRKARIQQT